MHTQVLPVCYIDAHTSPARVLYRCTHKSCPCAIYRCCWCACWFRQEKEKDSVWLIAPLIAKLSSAVQGKVLKTAGQVLETGNNFWSAKNSKDRERYLLKR